MRKQAPCVHICVMRTQERAPCTNWGVHARSACCLPAYVFVIENGPMNQRAVTPVYALDSHVFP